MPLTFDPPDLADRWKKALSVLVDHCHSDNWPHLRHDDFDPEEWGDQPFTEDYDVEQLGPHGRTEDSFTRKVSVLLEWADEIPSAKLYDRTIYVSKLRALVHVWPVGGQAHRIYELEVDGERLYPLEITHGGRRFDVCLTFGLTPFAFFVGDGDKYCPVVQNTDPFVEVRFEGKAPSLETIRDVVAGFMFAISSLSAGDAYEITAFREPADFVSPYDDGDGDEDDESDRQPPGKDAVAWEAWWERRQEARRARKMNFIEQRRMARLRPLAVGPGLSDLYSLFNHGLSENRDDEYRVLCFAKVLEFVALTAVKQKSHGEIRKRLMDPRALAPDARFIEDLIQLVDAQRDYRRDAEALKLAVREFGDPVTLTALAPAHLPLLRGHNQTSSDRDKERVLDELAAAISATRNQIAHGKANYTLTGKECPKEQLSDFVVLLKAVAIQAINWFGTVPEAARVMRA